MISFPSGFAVAGVTTRVRVTCPLDGLSLGGDTPRVLGTLLPTDAALSSSLSSFHP